MKAKELIEKLKTIDPESEVKVEVSINEKDSCWVSTSSIINVTGSTIEVDVDSE